MKFAPANRLFEGSEPFYKELLSIRSEMKAYRIISIESNQIPKDGAGQLLGLLVGSPIDLVPVWFGIRPYQQLEPLNKAVIARTIFERIC